MELLTIILNYKDIYLSMKSSDVFSNNTYILYKRVLDEFYIFLFDLVESNPAFTLENIDKITLNTYMELLRNKNISISTRKLYLTIIKGFLKYIADDDLRRFGGLRNQIAGYSIKVRPTKAGSFSPEERIKILNYTDKLEASINSHELNYQNIRDSLIIRLLLLTGLRATELCNIKHCHVKDFNATLFEIEIINKGGELSEVFIKKSEMQYLMEKLTALNKTEIYLFQTERTGNQLNKKTLLNICNKHLRILGIDKTGVHIFRHTFARHFQSLGKEGQTLQALMRHKNYSTTAKYYADVSKLEKSKIMAAADNSRDL